jgi:4-amino-4-deoxy-L-arabinose transferase-like glycosyltransferase
MFANGHGQGLYTPTYLYTLLVWTRLFGASIVSLRALSATFSIGAMLGIWLLVRRIVDARAAALAVVAAALSPWSFQVARLAVDAPMAPMLLVFAVYLFLRSPRAPWAAAAGVVMVLAAYTYPPTRVQAPLLVIFLLVVERARLDKARVAAFVGAMALTAAPLAIRLWSGQLMARSQASWIFSAEYIKANHGQLSTPIFLLKQVLENLFEHLRPSYLFFTGDANLRHSTQIMGELGWLDILALACFLLAGLFTLARAFRPQPGESTVPPSRVWLVAVCAIVAGACGTLPTALCWEGLPHALRSMGAWPAVAVFTGSVLSVAWRRWPLVRLVVVVLALGQTAYFVPYYYRVYPKKSYGWWGDDLRAAADTRDPAAFAAVAREWDALGYRYYLTQMFGETCLQSRDHAARIGER